jgi:valyl-tRNA synthetase
LDNPGFVSKAPPAVVAQQQAKREELQATLARLEKQLAATLSSAK